MEHIGEKHLPNKIIGRNIRSLRKECGQSQQALADMVGVNRSFLSQVENGKANVSVDVLVRLADGLDKPLAHFFVGLESCPPCKLNQGVAYAAVQLPESGQPLEQQR